jgi:hypothetical protein
VSGTEEVIRRLVEAWNGHDLETFLACFDPDYESWQPLFPERSFRGRANVRERWSANFATMPDFRADERGVVIYGLRDGLIARGRLYMSPGPDDASRSA